MKTDILKIIDLIRKAKPLILNHTNFVTMDFMANSLLALGAAPIMTVCDDEVHELVQIASCINLNIGTLDTDFIKRSEKIISIAKQFKKPIVLDPVGAGATHIRTQAAKRFVGLSDIVKGNASEIMALVDVNFKTHGVESINTTHQAAGMARALSCKYKNTVAVSGEVDFITDGTRDQTVPFGSDLMAKITGMGCVLGAIIAAFRAVLPDSFLSAQYAMQYFSLCGEYAGKISDKPATFKISFIDALYSAECLK